MLYWGEGVRVYVVLSRFLYMFSFFVKTDSLGHKPWSYFSAVCWLYGRNLHRTFNYKIPIGLVASTWGGTAIELWSSTDALKQCNITENHQQKHTDVDTKLTFHRYLSMCFVVCLVICKNIVCVQIFV